MYEKFKGIFPALLTPFDKDDRVNAESLAKLINRTLDEGVNGFYVNGTTAEVFMLTPEERRLIYRIAAEANGGRGTLIAHVGAISTKEAIEYGLYARSLGYDAISAVAPFYYKFSFEQIKKHYFDIQRAVGLPMFVYNFPVNSGVNLSASQIGEFLEDDGFIGVKHTSVDYFAMQQFRARFPEKIIYNGYDESLICGLAMGADGGIGSTYNFMAPKIIRIREKFLAGDVAGAQAEQNAVSGIIAGMLKAGVHICTKEILTMQGIDMGKARSPFPEISDEDREMLRREILPQL